MFKIESTRWLLLTVACGVSLLLGAAPSADDVQRRMDGDIGFGKPLVAHVIVALCDNETQGIVPVPQRLGNGDSPGTNLYWGAMYGVKTYFSRHQKWRTLRIGASDDPRVLDRAAFQRTLDRQGTSVRVFLIAEAWRGKHIDDAIMRFLALAAGRYPEQLELGEGTDSLSITAGGSAHLVAYVGHNGLMDSKLPGSLPVAEPGFPRSSIILACYSARYFRELPALAQAHGLLMTTGLMAPEAYTLESAVSHWLAGETARNTVDAAAAVYADFQDASLPAVKRLFITDD